MREASAARIPEVVLGMVAICAIVASCGHEADTPTRLEVDAGLDFGRPCLGPDDCSSGLCVPHAGDTVCSRRCDPDMPCPEPWDCTTGSSEVAPLCVSPFANLCRPCAIDADCAGKDPGACIDYGGAGTF